MRKYLSIWFDSNEQRSLIDVVMAESKRDAEEKVAAIRGESTWHVITMTMTEMGNMYSSVHNTTPAEAEKWYETMLERLNN